VVGQFFELGDEVGLKLFIVQDGFVLGKRLAAEPLFNVGSIQVGRAAYAVLAVQIRIVISELRVDGGDRFTVEVDDVFPLEIQIYVMVMQIKIIVTVPIVKRPYQGGALEIKFRQHSEPMAAGARKAHQKRVLGIRAISIHFSLANAFGFGFAEGILF